MQSSQLDKPRFIVGMVLIAVAVLMFLFVKGDHSTAGAIAFLVLGVTSIATPRRGSTEQR